MRFLLRRAIGIPLYIRAEAVIPLSAALVKKGMALGSVMTLIMVVLVQFNQSDLVKIYL